MRPKAHTLRNPLERSLLQAAPLCHRYLSPGGWACGGLQTAAPSGLCGREMAPATQPTGRALTKGIWSFFQNKYKNHVKQLDPHQAVSCWKCHVESHDVGVIKGLEVSRKHPEGRQREDAASLYCQAVGVQIPVLVAWEGEDGCGERG